MKKLKKQKSGVSPKQAKKRVGNYFGSFTFVQKTLKKRKKTLKSR